MDHSDCLVGLAGGAISTRPLFNAALGEHRQQIHQYEGRHESPLHQPNQHIPFFHS